MKPYKAIINISAVIHEIEDTGETGKSVGVPPLKSAGIKNFLITLNCNSLDECLILLKEKMEKLKNVQ